MSLASGGARCPQLYTDLDRRLREAGVLAGLRSADDVVCRHGARETNSPRVIVILPLSIFAGLLFGVMLLGLRMCG